MPLGTDYAGQDCSLARALELVGERWTMLILRDCFLGVRRFSDLQAHLDISRAVLSQRLAQLVDDGLLRRTADPHAEYELTQAGLELWPALFALLAWGERRTSPGHPRRVFSHAGCGTLGADGRCTTCGVVPPPADIETAPGPAATLLRDDPVALALRETRRLLEPIGR